MRDTMRASEMRGIDCLPGHIKLRMQNGLRLLADAYWYRQNTGQPAASAAFAVTIGELLHAGMTLQDCEWLLRQGFLKRVSASRDKSGQRRPPHLLSERVLVVLSDEAYAELVRAGYWDAARVAGSVNGHSPAQDRRNDEIRYDAESRRLFLRETFVLRLTAAAKNMEAVVARFQEQWWRPVITGPFAEFPARKRAQAARDAVYGLNTRQDPLRIEFHSDDKGSKIWYAVVGEQPSSSVLPDPRQLSPK